MDEIAAYIGRDAPQRAISFIGEIEDKMALVAAHPFAFPLRPEYGDGVRRVIHSPYNILYRVTSEEIRVERRV